MWVRRLAFQDDDADYDVLSPKQPSAHSGIQATRSILCKSDPAHRHRALQSMVSVWQHLDILSQANVFAMAMLVVWHPLSQEPSCVFRVSAAQYDAALSL